MTRQETSRYTDLMPDGKAREFSFIMEAKSVITHPSGGHRLKGQGFHEISGLAWGGSGASGASTCRPTAAPAGGRRRCRSRC